MDEIEGIVLSGTKLNLDYYLEHTPVWTITEKFYDQPYILCYLGNFGGNIRLSGNFHQASERIEKAFSDGGSNMAGIGSTLEGFGINQFMYEFVLDKAWDTGLSDEEWVRNLAARRVGFEDPHSENVWKTLTDSIYIAGSFSSQTPLPCARPCLEGYWHWTSIHNVRYDNATLIRAWKDLLEVPSDRYTYSSDVVILGTQALGNHFVVLRDEFTAAYRQRDIVKAREVAAQMRQMLYDIDALVSCDTQFSLKRWLDDASECGHTPEEAAYYRRNARTIISILGDSKTLLDYATRLWGGMMASYCAPRWEMYIDEILLCIEEGREYDQAALFERLTEFEKNWAVSDDPIDYQDPVDPVALSRELILKYAL